MAPQTLGRNKVIMCCSLTLLGPFHQQVQAYGTDDFRNICSDFPAFLNIFEKLLCVQLAF